MCVCVLTSLVMSDVSVLLTVDDCAAPYGIREQTRKIAAVQQHTADCSSSSKLPARYSSCHVMITNQSSPLTGLIALHSHCTKPLWI